MSSQDFSEFVLTPAGNLDFGEWVNVFGDEKMTAALLDRITNHAHILLMNGDSYRFRQSLQRQNEGQKSSQP